MGQNALRHLLVHAIRHLLVYASVTLLLGCVRYIDGGLIQKQPAYTILAPTVVRPNQEMKVSATIMRLEYRTFTVMAVIKRVGLGKDGSGSEIVCGDRHTFTRPGSYNLRMRTPKEMTSGSYTIRVSGFSDPSLTGYIFSNETQLFYESKQVSVFIITSKPFYNRGETVDMRIIPIRKNLLPITEQMDVRIKDPVDNILKEWWAQQTNAGGVVSLSYKLNRLFPRYGRWTIEVDCLNHIYTQYFRVDEFYLPVFYVNVTMATSMVSDAIGLFGHAESLYTSLRPVRGNATIKLEIISSAKQGYPTIMRRINYFIGKVDFMFSRQEMEAAAGGQHNLVGKQLKVTVLVQDWVLNMTSKGSQVATVYDNQASIKFLEGSIVIFKPGQPFSTHVIGYYTDGSRVPAHITNRTVNLVIVEKFDHKEGHKRSESVSLSRQTSVGEVWLWPSANTKQFVITAKFENRLDTLIEMVANRYWSPSRSYIYITTATKRPQVKQFINFHVITNTFVERIYYTIVSGGSIISSDQLDMGTKMRQLSIPLSQDMAPSAKIIVYFMTPGGQVVADSLNFHVENNDNENQLSVTFNKGKDLSMNMIELKLTADPLAYVSFGALEYQLYELGTRNGLSKQQVTSDLYTYDSHSNSSVYHTWYRNGQYDGEYTQHTRSYGYDANTTFFYAGLYIFSDANVSSLYTPCNMTKGEFPCMDGSTCYNYKDICNGIWECPYDHRDEMGCANETKQVTLYEDADWRTKSIRSNSANPGFLWAEEHTKPDGTLQISFPVINYPSSWAVTALAISREHGLSLLEKPAMFDGTKPVFLRVESPGSIKLFEHLSLSVVVFNRWHEAVDILVVLKRSPHYEPLNWNRETNQVEVRQGKHQILVSTLANSERQLYIPITFNTVGRITVELEALSSVGYFKHKRKIDVAHQGIPELYITSYQVDLRKANSEKVPDFHIPVKESVVDPEKRILNHVDGSAKSDIYVVGDIIGVGFAPEYKNYLSGRKLANSPDYSADNALFNFAINFYSLNTLRSLSTAPARQVNDILKSMNLALQEIFSHQMPDGSFRAYRWSQTSSTWVTAHFVQIMSDVKRKMRDLQVFIHISQDAINRAAVWLTKQQGLQPGIAMETGNVNNKWLEGKLSTNIEGERKPANISLTALVLIALSKVAENGLEDITSVKLAYSKHLREHVNYIDDPFEIAIAAQALAVAGDYGKKDALRRLKELKRTDHNRLYWSKMAVPPINRSTGLDTHLTLRSKDILNVTGYTVSTTAYALSAYLLNKQPISDMDKIQKFLQEQRMYIGGWTSSFDTLIAVEALSMLAERDQDRGSYNMKFVFRSDQNPDWVKTVQLNKHNWFIPQRVSLPSHWGSVQTRAKGFGVALLQMKTIVNYEHQQLFRKSAADYFDINFSLTTSGFNHSHLHYNICPTWKGPGERSGAVILDFTVPSGFILPNGGLQSHVRNSSPFTTIRNGEARGSQITVYFDYVDRSMDNCLRTDAQRRRTSSNITQNHYVRVFDFFEPGIYTQRIVDRVEFNKLTVCLACGSYQCQWCPDYAAARIHTPNTYLVSLAVIIFALYQDSSVRLT